MTTRRDVLKALTGLAVAMPGWRQGGQAEREIRSPLNGPIGLQLWSLRNDLPKDLAGTLGRIRAMGFREVEGAGLWGSTAPDLRRALDAAGLRCQSAHMGLERLRADLPGALAEARTLGATWVVCPWIAEKVSREDILRAADEFNRAAKAASDRGMRFAYHCHGYEFIPSAEGTLFDTLANATDARQVEFQIDVFHAFFGGADPAALITRHAARVTSLHLKDLKKGVTVTVGTSVGTPDIDVPLGAGQLDLPAILRAAMNAGTRLCYIEDESADPLAHIPQSVAYLEAIGPAVVQTEAPPAPGRPAPLFDGRTLSGWEGDATVWRVEDGAITGGVLTEAQATNQFLASTREFSDFVLRFQIKLLGTEGFVNSGMQIRSQRKANTTEMIGYQCDYGDPNWWGGLYDESRRNTVLAAANMATLGPAIRRGDWNDYVIRAQGPRITTWINGVMGVDYRETDSAIPLTGRLGIQLHSGGKAVVQVRNITIEEAGR